MVATLTGREVEIFCPCCGTKQLAQAPDETLPDYQEQNHTCYLCLHVITADEWMTTAGLPDLVKCQQEMLEWFDLKSERDDKLNGERCCPECGREYHDEYELPPLPKQPECWCGFCQLFGGMLKRLGVDPVQLASRW